MSQSFSHSAVPDADAVAGLCLPASLDLIHAEGLLSALQAQLGRDVDLRVDGSTVAHVSTACMQVLVAASVAARQRGCGFAITEPSSALCGAARDLGLAAILGISATDGTVAREIG